MSYLNNRYHLKRLFFIFFLLVFFINSSFSQDTLTKKEIRRLQKNFLLQDWPWTIEVPLWIPGFAGSFAYGDIDIEGEDGVDPENPIEQPPGGAVGEILSRLFTKNWYLKFFFLTKVAYEKNKFIAQFDAISGAVGESVKFNYNDKEIVQASFRTINLRAFGGYKIVNTTTKNEKFRYELIAYLGARMYFQQIYSDLNDAVNKLDINPVWFEPIIGIQNQFTWKRWFVIVQGDYGGYFDPSKHSFQASGFVYFRSGKITSVKLGWNHLYLNYNGTFMDEEYKINATFSGPSAGIAFHF